MQKRLTVLIPCKDEESNLPHCVASARLVADEILIADSGSTDNTLAVARSLSDCRLIEREFVGYADFKNWAIPQAQHEWVLILDADERVTPELAAEIREVLTNPPERFDAYRIRRRTFFMGHELRYGGMNKDDVCRLIRRDVCRYGDRRVHEEIDISPQRWGHLKQPMIHYWIRSYDHYFSKFVRYTSLGAQEYGDLGKRAGWPQFLLRPALRFLQLYVLRGGFLDGRVGVQYCMLTAFFNTFVKQARLWEMQNAAEQSDVERRMGTFAAAGEIVANGRSNTYHGAHHGRPRPSIVGVSAVATLRASGTHGSR